MNNDELEKRVTPRGFLGLAQEYFKAYKILHEKDPHSNMFLRVKYFLLLRSLELAFKSELRLKGYPAKDLKSRLFGHDLERIIMELYEKHNIVIDKNTVIRLLRVNEYYKTKQFEYPLIGYKEFPSLEALEDFVHLSISRMLFQLDQARSKK